MTTTLRSLALLICSSICLFGQQYVISTVAGGAPPPTPALATSVAIPPPAGLVVNSQGEVFFTSNHCILKLDVNGVLTRVAGTAMPGYSGDGGLAVNAQLNYPTHLAIDRFNNLLVADAVNYRIRRISAKGIITTIAGNGQSYFGGFAEGVPAVSNAVGRISALATDKSGNIFVTDDVAGIVGKISSNGLISIIAGGGSDVSGDGIATNAKFLYPQGLAVDGDGNVLVSDNGENLVRRIDSKGFITTIAGTGKSGLSGDGGPSLAAQFAGPGDISVDGSGNIYIADRGNYIVRKISVDGTISTIAGGGNIFPGSGSKATQVGFCTESISGLSTDSEGNLFIAACWIQKVSRDGILTNIAGNGIYNFGGDGGPATKAQFSSASGLAVDGRGNLYIADRDNNRIRRVGTDGNILTIAGNDEFGFGGDGGPATQALLNSPTSIAIDGAGNLFFTDTRNSRIRKVSPSGQIATVSGNGTLGFSPDGTKALEASIRPGPLAVDKSGNLIFVDGFRIRKIGSDGILTTLVGNGTQANTGDGGPAVEASLANANAIAIDGNNNVLISSGGIRKISPDGIITSITTIAAEGSSGEDRPASKTIVNARGIAGDSKGNVFLSDFYGLRRVSPDGIISTIVPAHSYIESFGDGGPASRAALTAGPLVIDVLGQLFVLDHAGDTSGGGARIANVSVRLLKPTNQTILIGSVRDAASQAVTSVSPGKILVVYGDGMGPNQLLTNSPQNGAFKTSVGGTEVFFDGIPAPMLYTSAKQIACVAPYAIAGKSTSMSIRYNGQTSDTILLQVEASSPGIFSSNGSGAGQAAAVNADGSINDAAHPVPIGSYLSLYVTGEGQTSSAGRDGILAPVTSPAPKPLLPITVKIGGLPANVLYAGGAPGLIAGLMQVVLQIPELVQPGGYVPVELSVGGRSTEADAAWIAAKKN